MPEGLSTIELVESLPDATRALIVRILSDKYPPNAYVLGGKCCAITTEIANGTDRGTMALVEFFDSGMADKHDILLGG